MRTRYQKMNSKKLFLAFLIGSSILATVWSEIYLGYSYDKAECPCDLEFLGNENIKFWLYPIIVPTLFGLFNVLAVLLSQWLPWIPVLLTTVLTGMLFGLLLSFAGRFGFDFPKKVFMMQPQEEPKVHFVAPLLYGAIFGIVLYPLNNIFVLS